MGDHEKLPVTSNGREITSAAMFDLATHGAARHRGAASGVLDAIERTLGDLAPGQAGVRVYDCAGLSVLLTSGPVHAAAARYLGPSVQPVRAILFDKSDSGNWGLGWHQDRVVIVRERRDTAGFANWTHKQGLVHVAPPPEVSAAMLTVRVHFDDVPADNAPLLIAPGSHLAGHIAEPMIASVVERCGVAMCLAARGDVWIYATPILHASAAAARHHPPRHRRVLQIDYAAHPLPGGLAWRGI